MGQQDHVDNVYPFKIFEKQVLQMSEIVNRVWQQGMIFTSLVQNIDIYVHKIKKTPWLMVNYLGFIVVGEKKNSDFSLR